MLRFHLPPNFAAAASRDAIPLKVELDLSSPPSADLLPALALLQRWCGTSTPPKFLQLSRSQLRELATAAGSRPLFMEAGQLVAWRHDAIVAPEPRPAAAPSTVASPPSIPPRKSSSRPTGSEPTIDGSEHFLAITLPSREDPHYAELLELLKTHGFVLEPSNRKWWLRDRHKTLNFLAQHGARLRDYFGAEPTSNFEKNTARLRHAEVATEIVEASDGFNVTVGLRAGAANDETIRSAVAANRGYVESDGAIYLLDADRVRRVQSAQQALGGGPSSGLAPRNTQRIRPARVAEAQEILEQLSPDFQPPEAWRARSDALRNLSRLTPAPIAAPLDAQLRPYQRIGVAWLWHLFRHELGGILADEMGLGKTLQALALLSAVKAPSSVATGRAANAARSPSLVVCPASLLENWRRESAHFTPHLRVFVHHGERRLSSAEHFEALDLIITSYGTLTRDSELFAKIRFTCVIADEAQHIKNRRSQAAAALRAQQAGSRFLLTGTPLENAIDDLRSLFEFLLPGFLDRVPSGLRAEERAWFDDRLRAKVAPYILRRTKQAVAPELPPKLEQIVWCELTPTQAALYRNTQERTERELLDLETGGASEAKLRFAALTQLLRLRQICCDPRLVGATRSAPEVNEITAEAVQSADGDKSAANPPPSEDAAPYVDSAKLEAFRELLAEAIDDGHRILVFSQFTSLLGLLREELTQQDVASCYLDGSMAPRARQAEVDRFQSSHDIPVFLISLKAGGTGLNLTAADTVVHFDPWWNPAVEAQATDRAHRIGQTRVVTSYKLIASGTVEEKVLALQDEKRALLADVFEASDATASRLSLSDLKTLLSS
jgi:superfamily II DNA or RNA helicase